MTNLMRMSVLAAVVLFSASALAGEAPRRPAAQPARPAPPAQSQIPTGLTPDTAAKQAFIIDAKTGTVLFDKNADDRMAPSSMSKMMTSYLVFKALKEGRLQLDSKLPVSQRAWRMQGSKMFVMVGTQVTVEDLIRGMVIQSGNDACIVLAEGLAGSEDAFAEQMTVEGRKIGLKDSVFKNASGWPDPEEFVTARDLAILAQRVITEFPDYYRYFSEMEFTYGTDDKGRPIKQGNRNPLLYKNLGADGVKTGHTDAGGYGLTGTAVRDGRRVIVVLNGMSSIRQRDEESARLIEWAFREWGTYTLFKAGDIVDKADVWLGTKQTVQLVAAKDIELTIPRRARPQLKVAAIYDSPIAAPVAMGQEIGKLVVTAPGAPTTEMPLVADASSDRLGFTGRVSAGLSYLLWGSGKK